MDFTTEIESAELSQEGKQIANVIISNIVNYFEGILKKRDEQLTSLSKQINTLQDRVVTLEEKLDSESSYERRDALIISGEVPAVEEGEDCKKIVCEILKQHIRVNLQPTDISISHRIGMKPKKQEPDKRNIIFKLCRRDLKPDILNACREFKPPFLINESLTPTRSKIMYVLHPVCEIAHFMKLANLICPVCEM